METIQSTPEIGEDETVEKETKRRVFVEIGTHVLPVTWQGAKKFNKDNIYIGIDISGERVRRAKEKSLMIAEGVGSDKDSLNFINASADKLPLADSSADEVFLGNVLGDPGIKPIDKKKAFLKEAERILKEGGRLIIKENNTPLDYEGLRKVLEGTMFSPEKFLTPKDAEWDKEIAKYERIAVGTEEHWPIFLAYLIKGQEGGK
ncbi:MAG: methyltransferase domain-containing protein [Patescibacteria group bacterium]